jgi:putative nucleotidyltransferase with HDIG domain
VVAHENVTTIVQREEAVTAALLGTIKALSDMAEVRDPYPSGHQQGVARLAVAIARQMGLDAETRRGIQLGAQIHDIGKIAVPAEILNRPGRLSEMEMHLIRTHCQVGHDIIADIRFSWPIAQIVLQHHERMDGSGYPNGLVGEQISLEARIVAVADVVDAVSSHRPYRPSRGIATANALIREGTGTQFDTDVVEAYFCAPVQHEAADMYASPENR